MMRLWEVQSAALSKRVYCALLRLARRAVQQLPIGLRQNRRERMLVSLLGASNGIARSWRQRSQ